MTARWVLSSTRRDGAGEDGSSPGLGSWWETDAGPFTGDGRERQARRGGVSTCRMAATASGSIQRGGPHQLSSTDSTVGLAASFGHANATATRPFMP